MRVPPVPTSPPRADGAVLLKELHAALCRYVVFPSGEAADATTLWVAATHAQPAWEHAPRLVVVVAETCHAPLITVNATIAAVVRSIGEDPPTLLVDEADTLWGSKKQADQNEDLRGLLNAGHQRNRPMLRWDITTRSLDALDTFAMAMLASIGDLPDTIMDRAVVIRMRRRAPGEQVDPYRTRRDAPPLHELRDRLTGWAREHLRELQHAAPVMPLEDRAADTWEPLIATADLAAGGWPDRARQAAVAMTRAESQQEEDSTASVRLLADLHEPWSRYLPLHPLHALQDGETPGQPQREPVAEGEDRSATSATGPADVADVAASPDRSATGLTSDVAHVADVADHPRTEHNGWRFNQPMAPCVVCGTGTSNRAPSGHPLHLGCPHPEQDWSS